MRDSLSKYLTCILVCVALCGSSQFAPGVKISYGHYGSNDHMKWRYRNVAKVQYDRDLEVHQYNFPLDVKFKMGSVVRLGLRYAYGHYTAREKNTRFLPETNITHGIGFHCDLIPNSKGALKFLFSPGFGTIFMHSHELNPFYVGYETPYRIHTKWRGNYINMDIGAIYALGKSNFSIEGLLGLRFGMLELDQMTFAKRDISDSFYNSKIISNGGLFEIGLCYMFQPSANTELPAPR